MSTNVKMTEQEINEVVLAATKALLEGKPLRDVLEFDYCGVRYAPTNFNDLDRILEEIKNGTVYRVKPKTVVICGVEFTEDELPQKSIEMGRPYFLSWCDGDIVTFNWGGEPLDLGIAKEYNAFLTKEAAEKFAKVKNKLIEKALNGEFA